MHYQFDFRAKSTENHAFHLANSKRISMTGEFKNIVYGVLYKPLLTTSRNFFMGFISS